MSDATNAPTQLNTFRGPIYDINPTAGPASHGNPTPHVAAPHAASHAPAHGAPHAPVEVACTPAAANLGGAPLVIHEPAAGQHVDITLTPNQSLSFDFNPLDATATRHGDDLTLTFADGGVLVLHHVSDHGVPLLTSLQLPDGTIINPCELLQAVPGPNPAAGFDENGKIPSNEKIPQINPSAGPEINPAAGPTPIGAPPVTTPFEIPGLGNGLNSLGPLAPEGFTTTTGFPPPGNGGFPPPPPGPPGTPPGPPGPPPPPGPLFLVEDVQKQSWPDTGSLASGTHNYFTEAFTPPTGLTVTAFFSEEQDPNYDTGTPGAFPGDLSGVTPLAGFWGALQMNTAGNYAYTLSANTQTNVVPILASDALSQGLARDAFTSHDPYSTPLEDTFYIQSTDGTHNFGSPSDPTSLVLFTYGATVPTVSGSATGVSFGAVPTPPMTEQLLVTYTDAIDPAHSFQQLVNVVAGTMTFALGSDTNHETAFQPFDPGQITVTNLTDQTVTIPSFTLAGETLTAGSIAAGPGHTVTGMIDPNLSTFGDPGDTGSTSGAFVASSTGTVSGTGVDLTAISTYTHTASTDTFTYGSLYNNDNTVTFASDATTNPDVAILNLQSSAATLIQGGTGSDTLVWDNASAGGVTYDGGLGFNTLQLDNLSNMTLDFAGGSINGAGDTLAAGGNFFKNLEVIDLTDAYSANSANPGGQAVNTVTLTANDVLALTANNTNTILSGAPGALANGGADTLWVLGNSSDFVKLSDATGTWQAVSGPITQSDQTTTSAIPGSSGSGNTISVAANLTNNSQMVGYTEYTAVATGVGGSGPTTVHVYVENAVAQAGHVQHA